MLERLFRRGTTGTINKAECTEAPPELVRSRIDGRQCHSQVRWEMWMESEVRRVKDSETIESSAR